MALTVATNTGALMAQAAASSVNKEMELSMERLSTGKRINGASDDAAGVAIASRLTSEIRGTNQAIRNAMDGQALIDTAEGAHQEVENILQRMRELAVQASNDTNDANDRANLQLEMDQLSTEIDRISSTTSWAGQALMDGTGSFSFQVGSQTTAADSISASLAAMSTAGLGIGAGGTTTAATAATIAEVGNNVIQVGASPAEGDVYHFTAGGTDFAVKLGNIGETAVLTPPSSAASNGTAMSFSGNVLTVTAAAGGGNDTVNVNVNGIDVQVTAVDGEGVDDVAEDLKAAIEAHSEFASMGISITDADDGTLTFEPTTTYSVSTDGGTSYGASTTFAANGVEGVSGAIAAAINGQTSSDFLAMTATASSDGSVSLDQQVIFSSTSVTVGATLSLDTTALVIDGTDELVLAGLSNAATLQASGGSSGDYSIDDLATDLAASDEIETAVVNGNDIEITFADSEGAMGVEFTLTDEVGTQTYAIASNTIGTTADTSAASLSSDGTVLTLTPAQYNTGDEVKFTLNGEAFTVTLADDADADNIDGLVQQIQGDLDASVKHGGLTLTAEKDGTDIKITATAATTSLITDVSIEAASTTAVTSGLTLETTDGAQSAIDALDTAIQTLNSQRAELGAISNRLDSTVSNLTNISANLQAGRGRIEDADFAAETTSLAKSQILQQASTAMLAQANASKQNVLSLLQG